MQHNINAHSPPKNVTAEKSYLKHRT